MNYRLETLLYVIYQPCGTDIIPSNVWMGKLIQGG